MPVVIVEMWKGRSIEQKRRLVQAITDIMVKEANCSKEALHVIIHDIPLDSWGTEGILSVDEFKSKPKK